MTAAIASQALTAADRCDRCNARAYIRVTLPGGGELFFCAHHGRTHTPALEALSAEIRDESTVLAATPATAGDSER